MIETQMIFLALIVGRTAALFLIARVMHRQLRYITLADEVSSTRKTMLILTMTAVFANLIPLVADLILFLEPTLLRRDGLLIILSSNVIGDLVQAMLIWRLYSEAEE